MKNEAELATMDAITNNTAEIALNTLFFINNIPLFFYLIEQTPSKFVLLALVNLQFNLWLIIITHDFIVYVGLHGIKELFNFLVLLFFNKSFHIIYI